MRHFPQRAREVADLVGAGGEVGDLLPRPDAAPDPLRRGRQPPHRLGDRVGEGQRQDEHHRGEHDEEAEDGPALRGDHAVDVSALRRQLKRAARRHHVLDGNRDGNDRLALVVDAGGGLRSCPFSAAATSGTDFPSTTQGFSGRGAEGVAKKLRTAPTRRSSEAAALGGIGQIGADHRPVRRERARVQQQPAVAVVDARARVGRRDEAVKHRPDPLGIDGELDRLLVALARARPSGPARAAEVCPDRS